MGNQLHFIDYLVIGGYMVFALGVGVVLSRRASASTDNFFLGGRSMPWWLVGISMVATSFASDTPIVITEMVRQYGLQRIWWIFSACIALSGGMFLFSRLWRRAEITTDAEFLELRYHGRAAAFLRAYKAGWTGIVTNIMTMGWVTLAMTSVITTISDVDRWVAIALCAGVALIYATFSGFYGVVITDFVQFFIAVGSMTYLGAHAWSEMGGYEVIAAKIIAAPGYGPQTLSLFPDFSEPSMDLLALFIFVCVLWWTDSGGYTMQRLSSCKDERHATKAAIFQAIFQTSRAWMWIAVALVSIALYPDLSDTPFGDTQAYPMVMNHFLGPGFKGLLVTGFLAAYMSTIDTHLNWGASYIMTDIYRRFVRPEADEKHYMLMTRIAVVLLMALAASVVPLMKSVTMVWEIWALCSAGAGIIGFCRWFWWRISAFTELSALIGAGSLTLITSVASAIWPDFGLFGTPWTEMRFELKLTLFIGIVIPGSLLVTLLTPPVPTDKLEAFYRKVRPGGFWGVLDPEVRALPNKVFSGTSVLDFMLGLALMFGISLAIGYWLLGQPTMALFCLGAAAVGGMWVYRWYGREVRELSGGG